MSEFWNGFSGVRGSEGVFVMVFIVWVEIVGSCERLGFRFCVFYFRGWLFEIF